MLAALYIIIAAVAIALGMAAWKWFKTYRKYHGKMLITCPENHQPAGVVVDAKRAADTNLKGHQTLTLSDCTRWPERHDCDQACLSQIETSPENCMVRLILADWYHDKTCVLCGRPFDDIQWHDHKPALMTKDRVMVEWSAIPVDKLPKILETHQPICWNCLVAESFRNDHPELVTDRPWNRSHLIR